jgi:multicomponent Na+:H+ antiporter subunit E
MKNTWINYFGSTLILFLFWVAVSGTLKWPQLVVGLAAAIFVTYFNRKLLIKTAECPPLNFKTLLWLAGYFLMLSVDIVKANFQVAWIVLHPRMPIEPNLVPLEVDLDRVVGRVLLANSITLTPGTLTILADEKKFLVHALTLKSGEDLKHWQLINKLKQMERGNH